MAESESSRYLTQDELAAVLRRAAELDAEGGFPVPVGGLDPRVVEAAAVEAGLSPVAVRRALDEVLHPDEHAPDVYSGGLLPSRELVVEREVPGTAEEIEARVGRFLRRQRFEQKRVFADGSRWAPRQGLAANIMRGIDPGGKLSLKQVRAVSVTVSSLVPASPEVEPTVLVRVALDLRGVRSIHTTWLGIGGAAGGGAVVATGAWLGVDPLALLSLPVAGGLTFGGHVIGRREARSEVDKIHTAVAGLLDQLEHGERAVVSRGRRSRSSSRSSSSRRATLSTDTDTDNSSGPAAEQEDDRS